MIEAHDLQLIFNHFQVFDQLHLIKLNDIPTPVLREMLQNRDDKSMQIALYDSDNAKNMIQTVLCQLKTLSSKRKQRN